MMDFDERVPVGSNMYLPSCTYYVSAGADFSGLPSFSTRPMTYSYSSNLPQVQPVREVTFRDYAAIEASGKWPHRGNLPQCYPSADDMVHRDCLSAQTAVVGDMFGKNSPAAAAAAYHHHHHHHTSAGSAAAAAAAAATNFYGNVGRNGVLPQAFDQFYDTAYGNASESSSTNGFSGDKTPTKQPSSAPEDAQACRDTEAKEPREETSSPELSSGNTEEKSGSSSSKSARCS